MDVHFHVDQLLHPFDRPLPVHRWLVRISGGEIVYQYHLPVYRILIRARDVPRLAETWGSTEFSSMEITEVLNPARFDWQVYVKFHDGYPVSTADEAHIIALGGRIDRRFLTINTLFVTIPDRSIPALRARTEVEFVSPEIRWVVC